MNTYECIRDYTSGEKKFPEGEEITAWLRDPDTFESANVKFMILSSFEEHPDADRMYYVSATAGRDREAVPIEILDNLEKEAIDDVITLLKRQIGELKAKEGEIRKSEARHKEFADSLPETVYEARENGNLTFLNLSGLKAFGRKKEELKHGLNILHLFAEEARTRLRKDIRIMLSGKIEGEAEYVARRKDGSTFPVIVHSIPVIRGNAAVGLRGIAIDITARKQMEEELERRVAERTAELAEANAELESTNEKLQKAMDALWGEMELARKLQTCLLPTASDNIHPDFEIAATMLPADEVGGDFYEITLDRLGHLWLSIGDVCGHGVTPGLIMMMAQTAHTTVTTNYQCSPRDIVSMINKVLYKNVHERLGENHFMTFTALKYLGEGRFQHAGAHLDLVVYRRQRQICERIETTGTWLNLGPDISYATENSEFTLDIGDVLVLYTDGLTEVWNSEKNMLEIHGFIDIVQTHAEKEIDALQDAIITDVMAWCNHTRNDDMSLVVVRRRE